MTRALYPGTFDPITLGHLDLMKRALKVFDHLVVAVAESANKKPLFSPEERVELVRQATRGIEHLEVVSFDGLLVEVARAHSVNTLLKGLRAVSDFEYEFQMALMNRKLDPQIETAFLMPSEPFIYLSSTVVKEIASLGGDFSELVTPEVERALRARFGQARPPGKA